MCGMDNLGDDLMYHAVNKSRDCSIEFVSRMNWKAYFSEEQVRNAFVYQCMKNKVSDLSRKSKNIFLS